MEQFDSKYFVQNLIAIVLVSHHVIFEFIHPRLSKVHMYFSFKNFYVVFMFKLVILLLDNNCECVMTNGLVFLPNFEFLTAILQNGLIS